jgi:tungstate transport system ATP-binding protein
MGLATTNQTSTHSTLKSDILPMKVQGLYYAPDGDELIRDVSFELQAGPKTMILGPNGAGKSLLLRLCHGLLEPSSGYVTWASANTSQTQRRQAMVFQRPVLLRRSVADNIDYALKLHDIAKADRAGIIDDVLNQTGLARFKATPARRLSGGEQQKLALARAWACRPEVLFLDEPTASLDPAATHAVENIVQTMHDEGTCIVMVTHDINQAKRLGDDVMFMHKGHLLEHASAENFFNKPESGEAAAFLKGELRW